MTSPPIVVLADDLTGAAEISAIGHAHGLRAVVALSPDSLPPDAELLVFDTDSRLNPADEAARKIRHIAERLPAALKQHVFKKTDSVLRGPVAAEVEAAATALGRDTVLLAPANPSLGRTIHQGIYHVNGVPLHQTSFAHDPHHPAQHPHVATLIGPTARLPLVLARPGMPLPSPGLILAEAENANDVAHWAGRIASNILPAGGADFFEAFIKTLGLTADAVTAAPPAPRGPTLIISGTTSAAGEALRRTARENSLPVFPIPEALLHADETFETGVQNWAEHIRRALLADGLALAVVDRPLDHEPHIPTAIRRSFARMVTLLDQRRAFHHLLVDGGATAAAVTRSLAWHQLATAGVWAPGVVSLQPLTAPDVLLTLKPGSYPWPALLWKKLSTRPVPSAS